MLAPDQPNSPLQRKEAHLIKNLPGCEQRLYVRRHAARTSYGEVFGRDFDVAVTPAVVSPDGLSDSVRVDAGGPADVTPPSHDLREVVQRAVPSGEQVLDHLLREALPPHALVQQRLTA